MSGFTLIEMVIVIVIIGILATALLPRLQGMQERAEDTARKADLSQIGTAMAVYRADYGRYPTDAASLSGGYAELAPYMTTVPTDPDDVRPNQ